MLPVYDPIFSVILFVGLLIYFGLKDVGEKFKEFSKDKTSDEEFYKWLRQKEIDREPESVRYRNWLYDHRQE